MRNCRTPSTWEVLSSSGLPVGAVRLTDEDADRDKIADVLQTALAVIRDVRAQFLLVGAQRPHRSLGVEVELSGEFFVVECCACAHLLRENGSNVEPVTCRPSSSSFRKIRRGPCQGLSNVVCLPCWALIAFLWRMLGTLLAATFSIESCCLARGCRIPVDPYKWPGHQYSCLL